MTRRKTILGAALAISSLGALGAAGFAAAPEYERRAAVRAAIEELRSARPRQSETFLTTAGLTLLDRASPEGALAVLDAYRRSPGSKPSWNLPSIDGRFVVRDTLRIPFPDLELVQPFETELFPLVEICELLAAEGSITPELRAALVSHATTAPTDEERFTAFYLLEELDDPSLPPEPPGCARATTTPPIVKATLHDALALIQASLDRPVEAHVTPEPAWVEWTGSVPTPTTPWRALLRIAQQTHGRIVVEPSRLVLVDAYPPRSDAQLDLTRGAWPTRADGAIRLSTCWTSVHDEGEPAQLLAIACPGRRITVEGRLDHVPGFLFGRPDKALRAFARLNGLEVVESRDGAVVLRRR
jgi:hypothetical protein